MDKSIVESPECIMSPVLRQILPTRLSGGTKAVILMKYQDRVVNASNCGNNCAKWILKLGQEKDLTINLNHIMEFEDEGFEIEILNDHRIVHNMAELVDSAIDHL